MYVRHFFRMLIGLLLMAIIGFGGLVLVNYYAQENGSSGNDALQKIVPSAPGQKPSTTPLAQPSAKTGLGVDGTVKKK